MKKTIKIIRSDSPDVVLPAGSQDYVRDTFGRYWCRASGGAGPLVVAQDPTALLHSAMGEGKLYGQRLVMVRGDQTSATKAERGSYFGAFTAERYRARTVLPTNGQLDSAATWEDRVPADSYAFVIPGAVTAIELDVPDTKLVKKQIKARELKAGQKFRHVDPQAPVWMRQGEMTAEAGYSLMLNVPVGSKTFGELAVEIEVEETVTPVNPILLPQPRDNRAVHGAKYEVRDGAVYLWTHGRPPIGAKCWFINKTDRTINTAGASEIRDFWKVANDDGYGQRRPFSLEDQLYKAYDMLCDVPPPTEAQEIEGLARIAAAEKAAKVEAEEKAKKNDKGRFILWNPSSSNPPTREYTSLSQARTVAEKMATDKGGVFYVCALVEAVEQKKTVTTQTTLIAADIGMRW